MDYLDKLGTKAYYIYNNRIKRNIIIEARQTGKMIIRNDLPTDLEIITEYKFHDPNNFMPIAKWFNEKHIAFTKEDLINDLPD